MKFWSVVGMATLLFLAPFTVGVMIEFLSLAAGFNENIFYASTFPTVIYPFLIYLAAWQLRKITMQNKCYKAAFILLWVGIGFSAFQWVLGLTMQAQPYVLTGHFMKGLIYYYALKKLRKWQKKELKQDRQEAADATPAVLADKEMIK